MDRFARGRRPHDRTSVPPETLGNGPELDPAREASASETRGHGHVTDVADRVASLEAEVASLRDSWLRSEADLQNARRRAAREVSQAEQRAFDRAFTTLLTFADDLERALQAAAEAGEKGPLVTGVELVLSRLQESLRAYGIEAIDAEGARFDPHLHEALMTGPSQTYPAGHVSQVVLRGYRHGDRLLRPARVFVSSGPEGGDFDEGAVGRGEA